MEVGALCASGVVHFTKGRLDSAWHMKRGLPRMATLVQSIATPKLFHGLSYLFYVSVPTRATLQGQVQATHRFRTERAKKRNTYGCCHSLELFCLIYCEMVKRLSTEQLCSNR